MTGPVMSISLVIRHAQAYTAQQTLHPEVQI